jgi:DNA-binding MarR family transcriptional regulator
MSNKLTNDLISLIFNTGQVLREKAREKSSFKECSFLHLQTLHYVKDKEKATMKDVANYLHITPPSATSLINSLVKGSFIKRIIDQGDRRTVKLEITKTGLLLLKNNLQRVSLIMEKAVNKLSEKEKALFINILNKLSE